MHPITGTFMLEVLELVSDDLTLFYPKNFQASGGRASGRGVHGRYHGHTRMSAGHTLMCTVRTHTYTVHTACVLNTLSSVLYTLDVY